MSKSIETQHSYIKKINHVLEYMLVQTSVMWIDSISTRSAIQMARSLGKLMYAMLSSRRKIAIENILRCGITSTYEHAAQIARKSFEHFAIVIVEALKAHNELNGQTCQQKASLCIAPETMDILRRNDTGIILASGHIGNWEVAVQMLSYLKPVVAVGRPMNNPYVEQLIMKRRSTSGKVSWIPKHDTNARRLVDALKNNSVLALMMDQYAGKTGITIDFFGHPASTHSSPALLHLFTRAPLFFGYCIRTGLMQYQLVGLEPIKYNPCGSREMDVKTIMEIITQQLETAIRANPEQYLWMHRRWRI